MTAATAEDPGRVGPYRVIQAIGAGGSARIDLARVDRAYGFQRHVVVKRPLEHLRSDPGVAASLRREARFGGRLRHPNLVAVLDAGIHDGYDYLVLEYVHGAALRAVMQGDAPDRVRALPLGVALAIVSDAARGMHEAHELTGDDGAPLGLVHRDVSPGNILLGLDGTVKLADFGIAKETRVSTLSGSLHGTVTYMAPEQCQGHAFDRRADVFSLGVILYELITGVRLFWADNDVASLHRVLSGAVPRPREIKPQIQGALEELVMTAVAHAPERRFATALALATAVERYAATAGEPLGARWIARALEAVIGPRPVPWLAAPAAEAPEAAAAPAPEGSLVDLIAASGADEPDEPGFGDAGEVDASGGEGGADGADAARTAALAAAPVETAAGDPPPAGVAGAPPDRDPPIAPAPPRRRIWLAAGLASAAIGAGIAAAFAMTGGTEAPATGAPAAARAEIAAPARPVPPPVAPESDRPAHAQAQADDRAGERPIAPTAAPGRDRPPLATSTSDPRPRKRKRPASPPPREPAEAARDARPEAAAAGSAQPPSNVEWKPTLLLPTDGSNGKQR
jgi:hypothetical protein